MTRSVSISQRRLRTWIRLLRLTRSSQSHLREFLRVNHNTTLPRFDVMAAMYRNNKPMKMSEISRMLLVSNGNSTNVVDRLEKDGLAVRSSAKTDKRVVEVQLTDQGRADFEKQAAAHEVEVSKLFSKLDHKKLDTMRDMLKLLEGAKNDIDG